MSELAASSPAISSGTSGAVSGGAEDSAADAVVVELIRSHKTNLERKDAPLSTTDPSSESVTPRQLQSRAQSVESISTTQDYLQWLSTPVPKNETTVLPCPKKPVPRRLWQQEEIAQRCNQCDTPFAEKLKHHCKYCGRIFCVYCSFYRKTINGISNQRVCKSCNGHLMKNPQSADASSRAVISSPSVMLADHSSEANPSLGSGGGRRRPAPISTRSSRADTNKAPSTSGSSVLLMASRPPLPPSQLPIPSRASPTNTTSGSLVASLSFRLDPKVADQAALCIITPSVAPSSSEAKRKNECCVLS